MNGITRPSYCGSYCSSKTVLLTEHEKTATV
jgi:hypothetical protein